jgi:hypothetical protein
MSTPKTSAAAIALLNELQIKRANLTKAIDSGADRCRGLAVAAHLGDADAADELSELEAEEATARNSMRSLDAAIAGIEQMREALEAKEAATRESRDSAELTSTIDELLALDDQCDDALDFARDLLEKRAAFQREKAQILRRQPGKIFGAMLGRENETAGSILAYFDRFLAGFNAGRSYAGLTRIAEFDSRYYGGRPSARMSERGPRELSPFEKTFRQAIAPRRSPMEVRQIARR